MGLLTYLLKGVKMSDYVSLEFSIDLETEKKTQEMIIGLQNKFNLYRGDAYSLVFDEAMLKDIDADSNPERYANIKNHIVKLKAGGSRLSTEGTIYFIKSKDSDHFKIGITKGSPYTRLRTIQGNCPFKLGVYAYLYYRDCRSKEKEIHEIFDPYRGVGEWFDVPIHVVNALIVQEMITRDISQGTGNTMVEMRIEQSIKDTYDKVLGAMDIRSLSSWDDELTATP